MKKILATILTITLFAGLFAGCTEEGTKNGNTNATASPTEAAALSGIITMSGSTSMEDLVNALGAAFEEKNGGVSVEVQVGGSSVGISNAKDGITDLGNSSRALKEEEKAYGLTEYIIALDGIAMVANPANGVNTLTMEQIAKIFKGEIKNWKDVGGADMEIVVVGREAGSGTRDGFESIVGVADKCVYKVEVNETGIVKTKVAAEAGAIGYMSLGKVDSTVKKLAVGGVEANKANVLGGSYLLQRPFVCLTKGNESKLVKAFIDFILGDEGKAIVESSGFIAAK